MTELDALGRHPRGHVHHGRTGECVWCGTGAWTRPPLSDACPARPLRGLTAWCCICRGQCTVDGDHGRLTHMVCSDHVLATDRMLAL